MLSHLDPSLKAKPTQKTANEEMPGYTKAVLEGEPLSILKHASRYLKKYIATRYLPHIIVTLMVEPYSGEKNMCSTPPAIKQSGYKRMPSDLMREAYDLQNYLL